MTQSPASNLLTDIARWQANAPTAVALATVVQTWGSAPRQVGAKMAFTPTQQISGSVSGGCVEGAVISAGQEVLQTGIPQLLHFGVADETAWNIGLACGGEIWVWVEKMTTAVADFLTQNQSGAIVTIIRGNDALLGQKLFFSAKAHRDNGTKKKNFQSTDFLNPQLEQEILAILPAIEQSQRYQLNNEIELFIDLFQPAPTLIIVGGGHISIPLVTLAQTVGYRTIVIDPRRAFANPERFPHADKLVAAWPDKAFQEVLITESTAVVLLTHDPKIDDPALHIVLNSPAFYIGALGSKKTHAARKQRLHDTGFTDDQINRIHGPIGLNIGAKAPAEIALAIIAQIIQQDRIE